MAQFQELESMGCAEDGALFKADKADLARTYHHV